MDVDSLPTMSSLEYSEFRISAYAQSYSTGEVERGVQLMRPYTYDPDGVTLTCPMCNSKNFSLLLDTWKIDLGEDPSRLLAPLTEWEAPLRPSEFAYKLPELYFCKTCGIWIAEEYIVGEDFKYAVQLVGSLGFYRTPDQLPAEDMTAFLTLQRTRMSEIPPKDFERLVAEFLRSEWEPCEVRHLGSAHYPGDTGIDLLLITTEEDYLVSVKHHTKHLQEGRRRLEGVKFIRELNGVLFRENKIKGILVTFAKGYTRQAKEEISTTKVNNPGYELILVDKLRLDNWLANQSVNHRPWRKGMTPGPFSQHPFSNLEGVSVQEMDF